MKLVDPEFWFLKDQDFPDPDQIRANYTEVKQLMTRLDPQGDEGRIVATISRSKRSNLERAAQLIWNMHRDFSQYMDRDVS
ncbi:MAG TPA: hypothetical protein VFS24_17660 [Steroidobacteraceae bacterium]|nr:hypothetical protein [Steroidobacteraceae bacterium]